MRSEGKLVPAAVVLAVVAAAHVVLAPRVAGVDAFYHVGHALEYVARGPFDTAFPWGTQSVIGDMGGDLWWGFHVLLIPFTALGSVAVTIRAAAVVLTLALAGMVWWVLSRHAVRHTGWWTAAFLIAVPNVLFRFVMVRPHVLSLGLGLVLASLLARGRWWQVLLVSAAITWLHLGLFWLAPGIVTAYALVRLGGRAVQGRHAGESPSVPVPAALAAVAAGSALGWLARPEPWATGRLAWIQIVRLLEVRAAEQPLAFASELFPLPLSELMRTSWMFVLVWGCAVAVGVAALMAGPPGGRDDRGGDAPAGPGSGNEAPDAGPSIAAPEATLFATCLTISVVFAALTLVSARRALVELVAFGTVSMPFAWALTRPSTVRRYVGLVLTVLACAHVPWSAGRPAVNAAFVAVPADLMAESATWLRENTAEGDIVFHARWDNFGPLFAHDRSNRYLGGMDPIFQFEHDPGRYWEHYYLARDLVVEYTCDAFPCYEGTATRTHETVRDHFEARWVLVEPVRNPRLTDHLRDDPGFTLVHRTRGELIFRVEP